MQYPSAAYSRQSGFWGLTLINDGTELSTGIAAPPSEVVLRELVFAVVMAELTVAGATLPELEETAEFCALLEVVEEGSAAFVCVPAASAFAGVSARCMRSVISCARRLSCRELGDSERSLARPLSL